MQKTYWSALQTESICFGQKKWQKSATVVVVGGFIACWCLASFYCCYDQSVKLISDIDCTATSQLQRSFLNQECFELCNVWSWKSPQNTNILNKQDWDKIKAIGLPISIREFVIWSKAKKMCLLLLPQEQYHNPLLHLWLHNLARRMLIMQATTDNTQLSQGHS